MKKIIARISNGFGNQMFVYASAYALAKKMHYELYLDKDTALNNSMKRHKSDPYLHWVPKYELDIFNISATIAPNELTFDTRSGYIKRKLLKFLDKFSPRKKFLVEKRDEMKKTKFINNLSESSYADNVFLEGLFETEKYFVDYKNDIKKEFSFNEIPEIKEEYLSLIDNHNSVSIAVRRDRYSEKFNDKKNNILTNKTKDFENSTFEYIFKSIKMIKDKINNPKFFIFSDNFNNLDKVFDKNNFTFIDNFNKNKSAEDFYLMRRCKHFIVGPTSFHWWAAWLSNYENKIIVCPKDKALNTSSNIDFWPESWIRV